MLASFINDGVFFRELSRSLSPCRACESCHVAVAALHDLWMFCIPSWPPCLSFCRTCAQASSGPGKHKNWTLATTTKAHSSKHNVQELLGMPRYLSPLATDKSPASIVALILKKYFKDFFSFCTWTCFFLLWFCVVLPTASGLVGEGTVTH